jgi:hypothetical protein
MAEGVILETNSLQSLRIVQVGNQFQMRVHPLAEETGTPRSSAYSNRATSGTRRSGFVIGAKRARTTPAFINQELREVPLYAGAQQPALLLPKPNV